MRELHIQNHIINDASECFVIAEVGHNHQGSLETCKKMFKEAANSGAHAVKLQKRNNKQLFTKSFYAKPYDNENSYGATYGEHREFLEFNKDQYLDLQKYAEALELVFFATPFDTDSVDFLEEIKVPCYKLASGDLRTIPLIEKIAKTGKPILISTGASYLDEVKIAYETVLRHHNQICILQCTSGYPIEAHEAHLNVLDTYRKECPQAVLGYSGHDNGILLPVIAYLKGARVIEKHFTLNRAWKGTDHKFSLEPVGMRKMVRDLKRVRECLGNPEKVCLQGEEAGRVKMGKSIYTARDLEAGTVLSNDLITLKSPGGGLTPDKLPSVLGRTLKRNMKEEEFITLQDLND
ncbi:MAG: N-acetylneuraminate synthase family protein [SAR324 cluster bacterium]|nr:N-acetylneuraminate synthase family protein [SAR324 cluster bacterium]